MIEDQSDSGEEDTVCEKLLDLLRYTTTSANLEQLLGLLETVLAPLSLLPKEDQEVDLSSERVSPGKEWVKVPRIVFKPGRLHLLVDTRSREFCKDSSFVKINTLTRRLSRVEANREVILRELMKVASTLGLQSIFDMKLIGVRLRAAQRFSSKGKGSATTSSAGVSLSTSYA